jgi:hypothetical protein
MKFTSALQITNRNVFHLVFAASLLALVLLAAIVPANAQSSASADNAGNSASIEGSWIFNIDVLLAQQPIATFNSLISFGGGGIVVTTPSAPPMGTFYGAWKCKKSDGCSAVFYAFASDSTGNVALQRLSLRLHLTGPNSLAGTGEGSSCNLQGENCVDQPGGFRFTGKRITSREE